MRLRQGAHIPAFIMSVSALSGCIHEYPYHQPPYADECKVSLNLQIAVDWRVMPVWSSRASAHGLKCMVHLESADRKGLVGEYMHEILTPGDSIISIDLDGTYAALPTDVGVWMDYCDNATGESYAYSHTDLRDVRILHDRVTVAAHHDSWHGNTSIDLGKEAATGGKVNLGLDLRHATARISLEATDMDQFCAWQAENIAHGETYTVMMEYLDDVPGGLDVLTDTYTSPIANRKVTMPLTVSEVPGITPVIMADRILTPADGMEYEVNLLVMNSAMQPISRTSGINVTLHPGQITYMRGAFLTNMISGGLTIDTKWGEEIEIPINQTNISNDERLKIKDEQAIALSKRKGL